MSEPKPNIYKLCQDVGELKGKIDQIDKKLDTVTQNHENRINSVEKIADQFIGKISVIGSITGFIGGIIVVIIGYFIKK